MINNTNIELYEASGLLGFYYINGVIKTTQANISEIRFGGVDNSMFELSPTGSTCSFMVKAFCPSINPLLGALVITTETRAQYELDIQALIKKRSIKINKAIRAYLEFDEYINSLTSAKILDIGGRARSGNFYGKSDENKTVTVLDIIGSNDVDVVCDAHEMSQFLPNDYFDAIQCFSVFEHLAMPWKVAIEMNKVLRKGGGRENCHAPNNWPTR